MATETSTWSGVMDIQATCECGWYSAARNALGNAARHARAHGHVVNVLQQTSITYAPRGMPKEEVSERKLAGWEATGH